VFTIDRLAVWILFSAWCSLSGWGLSALGCLNPAGYIVSFLLFITILAIFRRELWQTGAAKPISRIRLSRWRRPLPGIWLTLTLLAFVGGALYHPVNYDYLSYRFPRLLHWWWEQKWHWIHSADRRMNYSAPGHEWMLAPSFILFKSDRLFFLVNFISYLFLPGLVFSVFRRFGISSRISWWWMWLLPTAYCYILQAAGTGNDAYAATYLLAALYYALKTDSPFPMRHLALSCLAIALMTGAKASNIPLVLPWLAALSFNWTHYLKVFRPGIFALIVAFSAGVSFLPMGILNIEHTGSYTGDPANLSRMRLSNPVSGIVGNSLCIAIDNLAPPLWPKAIDWSKALPSPFTSRLKHDFPRIDFSTGEMQIEESTGMGVGMVVALGLMIGLRLRRGQSRMPPRLRPRLLVLVTTLAAIIFYMSTVGSEAASRIIAPYYIMLIVSVLLVVSVDGAVVRRRVCQVTACAIMLVASLLVVLSPSRPLFSPGVAFEFLVAMKVKPSLIARFNNVYTIYSSRWDRLKDLREALPSGVTTVGFCGTDDSEVSLWLPFGSRNVVDVLQQEPLDYLNAQHIRYVVVNTGGLKSVFHLDPQELINQWSARPVFETKIQEKYQRGPETWTVYELLSTQR
jgi:hypothetical protein